MTRQTSGTERQGFSARFARAWKVYTERRMLIILALGFSSGLPLALTGSTLAGWMSDVGVDLKTIGIFALVGLPYSIKFLWAPLIDHLRVPILTKLLGRRRAWLVITQSALIAAIVLMAFVDPVATPWTMAFAALLVAFASASQDIVIDAFRIESLEEDEQAAAMANYVAAYRVAMLAATGGAVALVSWYQLSHPESHAHWTIGYIAMAGLMLIGLAATLFAAEPKVGKEAQEPESLPQRFRHAVIDPFLEFAHKRQWYLILLFVILYKLGDAYAGHMMFPFAKAIGFDKATYAGISSTVGLVAAIAGGYIGGALVAALGQTRSLWIGGVLQMLSNLVFSWLAYYGPDPMALGIAVATESLTGAIGTVVFVGWLSSLCNARAFTATQYALLSALSSFGRTTISASGGALAADTGWPLFFVLSTLIALPGLLLLWWLQHHNAVEAGAEEKH